MKFVLIYSLFSIFASHIDESIDISKVYVSGFNLGDSKVKIESLLGKPDSITSERPIDFDYQLIEYFYYGKDNLLFVEDSLAKYVLWGDKINFRYEDITIGTTCEVIKKRFPKAYSNALKHEDEFEDYLLIGVNVSVDGLFWDDAIYFYISKKNGKIFKIEYWFPV